MKDKKQDLNSLEALVKTADGYREFFANLSNELSKVLAYIKVPEKEKDTWEMKCPYKEWDEYWYVPDDGIASFAYWQDTARDDSRFKNGSIFPTKQAAELEAKRRNLLTRFRAFRDECNNGWKADWESNNDRKHYILFSLKGELETYSTGVCNDFQLFGFFKNKEDAERAIELFGEEIKELFVECD